MSLSKPHPDEPYEQTGVKLGDEQFELAEEWAASGRLALVGMGVEPGLADVFARYAADHLFSEIDEVGVRDGANLDGRGLRLRAVLLDLDDDRGVPQPAGHLREGPRLVHHRAVQRTGGLRLPGGHRPGRVRERRARGGAAHPALGRRQAGDVQVRAGRRVHRRAEDPAQARSGPRPSQGARSAASRSRPATWWRPACPIRPTLGDRMTRQDLRRASGCGAAARTAQPRSTYLYHVVDNEWSMREYGAQAVVWQTAVNPIVALELIGSGAWAGTGVLGPEAFDAVPVPGSARRGVRIPRGSSRWLGIESVVSCATMCGGDGCPRPE